MSINMSKIVGIFFLLIGVIYLIMAFQLADASIGSPHTPKIFPAGLGLLLIGLSLGLLAKEFRTSAQPAKTSGKASFGLEDVQKIGLTAVFAFIYALLFDRLGYVISTILFLEALLFLFNGFAKWKQNTIVAVIFSIVVYVLFFKLLNVYLPPLPFFE
ncbi:hypothetical protein U27_03569 [Candidatus Vecturithrix granuli]|uniref:DUF1468 domain-containing protein n=1 Tax=Vecturithrix granuli TaxID=1499967 RepID=A0A081BWA2_VECG1|nr:hypothetical protein U27_03569 [Candidatus Vecturithrix granuli]